MSALDHALGLYLLGLFLGVLGSQAEKHVRLRVAGSFVQVALTVAAIVVLLTAP